MKLTLAQLEAFHWTLRLGSAHAAAERLHLSQPTITVRLRALERGLQRKLFERRGRRLQATTAGAALAAQAEQVLGLATRIEHGGAELRTRRLGAPDSFAMVCLPRLLRLLERNYPELTVDISFDNSLVLKRRLNQRDLDLAFISNVEPGDAVHSELLGVQDIAWVASPRLDLAARMIRPRDLAGCQIFTNPEPSRLNALVRNWSGREGVEPGRISTCNSLLLMRRLIVSSGGVSLMPIAILQSDLRSGALQRLATRPGIPEQRLYAAYTPTLPFPQQQPSSRSPDGYCRESRSWCGDDLRRAFWRARPAKSGPSPAPALPHKGEGEMAANQAGCALPSTGRVPDEGEVGVMRR